MFLLQTVTHPWECFRIYESMQPFTFRQSPVRIDFQTLQAQRDLQEGLPTVQFVRNGDEVTSISHQSPPTLGELILPRFSSAKLHWIARADDVQEMWPMDQKRITNMCESQSNGETKSKKPASARRSVVAAVSALADALLAALVALVALAAAEAGGEEIGRPEQRTAQDRREKGLMK